MKRYSALAACTMFIVAGCELDADERATDSVGALPQVVVSIDASITGVTKQITGRYSGTPFEATLSISRFANEGGAIVGYGTLSSAKGSLPPEAAQALTTQEIRLPIFLRPTDADAGIPDAGAIPATGADGGDAGLACPVLSLALQPVNVILAGATVELDKVDLGVKGRSGPGMLLGNILCGVLGQLGPNGLLTGLQPEVADQLVGFMNNLAGGLIEGIRDTVGAVERI